MAEKVEQNVFLMRHGARHDTAFPSWRSTASRPYDTPLSRHGHYDTPRLVKQRLTNKASCRLVRVSRQLSTVATILQGIEVVISSPFLRCLQTATHAYSVLGVEGLHTCNALCECLVVGNDMTDTPAVPALQDATDTTILSLDSEPLPDYPEKRSDCSVRYRRALDTLADKYWPRTLLLVTHQICVQEAVCWGGKQGEFEAEYCAHVQLSRNSRDTHNWTWQGDTGIYAYDTLLGD